ncbi:MAG: mannonate dehydratase [Oscillospiraceae bacterium]|nr:mannonate dehydratase [Oscillospiraceae bacterium]
MKMIFRWFGTGHDTIPLSYIRQIPGVEGVVTSLLSKAAGEVWETDEIAGMHKTVTDSGLKLEVIESVNIHEDIKLGLPSRDLYIENYIKTMERLSKIGIKVICYNFMPVLDWARSNLYHDLGDGSNTMFFNADFIKTTTPKALADKYAADSGGIALPGWEPERLKKIEATIEQYSTMTQEQYFANAKYFLDAIIPHAEKLDIKMAIHPDDPPFSIFSLPRMINSRENIEKFLSLNKSRHNGLTLCTGSIGANCDNDTPAIIREFSDRIHFAHIRNLKFTEGGSFYESAHPTACGSLDMYAIVKAFHDSKFEGYARPDHGRMIWDEKGRPGYGLYDRALGITYLLGLWEALERNQRNH